MSGQEPSGRQHPNGAWTDYAYDGANRIRQLINKDPAGAVLAAYGDTDYLTTGHLLPPESAALRLLSWFQENL